VLQVADAGAATLSHALESVYLNWHTSARHWSLKQQSKLGIAVNKAQNCQCFAVGRCCWAGGSKGCLEGSCHPARQVSSVLHWQEEALEWAAAVWASRNWQILSCQGEEQTASLSFSKNSSCFDPLRLCLERCLIMQHRGLASDNYRQKDSG